MYDFNSILGTTPEIVRVLSTRNPGFAFIAYSNATFVKPLLEIIKVTFPEYTCHDITHSSRVMNRMEMLIEDFEKLSDLELLLLIQGALYHDIGMVVGSDDEKEEIFKQKGCQFLLDKTTKEEAIRDYVRKTHGQRSANFIKEKGDFYTPSYGIYGAKSYTNELSTICACHQWGLSKVNELSEVMILGEWKLNLKYCALILRLADSLDLDSDRTPVQLYDLQKIYKNEVSSKHWQRHLSIKGLTLITNLRNEKQIVISGECNNSYIHREFLQEVEKIEKELGSFIKQFGYRTDGYKTNLSDKIENKVSTNGFTMSNLAFSVNYDAVVNLLSGENLYGDKVHGIREIIQNSIDACRYYREILSDNSVYTPQIIIKADKENNQIVFKDNGCGMTLDIIRDYFLSIGKSYYKSEEYYSNARGEKAYISCYGIGFLACFMLSSQVIVRTRHYSSSSSYEISILKNSKFVSITDVWMPTCGTEIIMNYDEFIKAMGESRYIKRISSFRAFSMAYVAQYISYTFIANDISIKCFDEQQQYQIYNPIDLFYNKEDKTMFMTRIKENTPYLVSQDYCFIRNIKIRCYFDSRLFNMKNYYADMFSLIDSHNDIKSKQDKSVMYILHLSDDGTFSFLSKKMFEKLYSFSRWIEHYAIKIIKNNRTDRAIHIRVLTKYEDSIFKNNLHNGEFTTQNEETKQFVLSAISACNININVNQYGLYIEFLDKERTDLLVNNKKLYLLNHISIRTATTNLFIKGVKVENAMISTNYIFPVSELFDPTMVLFITSDESGIRLSVDRLKIHHKDLLDLEEVISLFLQYTLYKYSNSKQLKHIYKCILQRKIEFMDNYRFVDIDKLQELEII